MSDLLRQLYWDGIVKLPTYLSADDADEFADHLKHEDAYSGHVMSQGDGIARNFSEAMTLPSASYRMNSVLTAPHFLEFALTYTEFAHQYLGEFPHLYSFNAFWTFPSDKPLDPNIQLWHRDRDDRKFLALFMYGTDVLSNDDGPHLFARGTHHHNDEQHRLPLVSEPVESIYGAAGTCFFADTSGLHMGVRPKSHERLLAWARWGVSNPPQSYGWDKLEPTPASKLRLGPVSQFIKDSTALVIDWSR